MKNVIKKEALQIMDDYHDSITDDLNRILDDCRERSVAKVKLDELFMWTVAGIEEHYEE